MHSQIEPMEAPRVWRKDGPEPPDDVSVLRDGGGDNLPFLVRCGLGWMWSSVPEVRPDVMAGDWDDAASLSLSDALVEVPDV